MHDGYEAQRAYEAGKSGGSNPNSLYSEAYKKGQGERVNAEVGAQGAGAVGAGMAILALIAIAIASAIWAALALVPVVVSALVLKRLTKRPFKATFLPLFAALLPAWTVLAFIRTGTGEYSSELFAALLVTLGVMTLAAYSMLGKQLSRSMVGVVLVTTFTLSAFDIYLATRYHLFEHVTYGMFGKDATRYIDTTARQVGFISWLKGELPPTAEQLTADLARATSTAKAGMPSVEDVTARIEGDDERDTLVKRHVIFHKLAWMVRALSVGGEFGNQMTAEETALMTQYSSASLQAERAGKPLFGPGLKGSNAWSAEVMGLKGWAKDTLENEWPAIIEAYGRRRARDGY